MNERRPWCWVSPAMLLAVASTVGIVLAIVQDVAGTLRRADTVQRAAALVRVELAADAAAAMFASGELPAGQPLPIGGLEARVEAQADEWLVTVSGPEAPSAAFVCAPLPGAAPPAFGEVATFTDDRLGAMLGRGRAVAAAALPQLDAAALAAATRADLVPGFRRDAGIALLNLDAGTDRDDFVWTGASAAPNVPGDLLVVPGNLWLDGGATAFEVVLSRDLVIVVCGNLYLGRSVRVRGARLVLATALERGATAFADADGNGRWTAGEVLRSSEGFCGPVEGGGACYVGLARGARSVQVDAGLVLGGELHVAADCQLRGPVVLPFGITELFGPHAVHALGGFTFEVERERVPGFLTAGAPRPGLLRAVLPTTKLAQQTLYPAAPAR